MNTITELLGCQYPIIQGAMGVISNPEMVAAVSEAGGYGLLATAFAQDTEIVERQVKATRELTDKPFGANLFVINPLIEAFADILAQEGAPMVTVSGGSPKDIIPILHSRSIKAFVVVPTADVARKSEALGADAIVAEGSESGGMQGYKGASTMILVPAVADAVKIPVIAAGGIGDARGYKAAFALGAQGVQVGTRFIATTECMAHDNYKHTIVQKDETGTGLVERGRVRIRALRTQLVENIFQGTQDASQVFASQSLDASWVKGDLGAGILPAGEVVGLISEVKSVREVILEMVSD